MTSSNTLNGSTTLEKISIEAAPWIYGIIIIVMLFSILWTFMGWNAPTKEPDGARKQSPNWDPFTVSVIALSSLVLVIGLLYLTLGVIHKSEQSLSSSWHTFCYYGCFLVLFVSAAMSIVNTTTDRPKRGDTIGITTIILNLITLFLSLFIASTFIRASINHTNKN